MKLAAPILRLSLALLGGALAAVPAQAGMVYQLDHRIALPGDDGWDYLSIDAPARRLFLTRGRRVDVMDLDSETMVGSVSGTAGVHGVALDPDLGKGFASDGLSGTVTVFDLASLKVRSVVAVGEHPDSIVYDPFSRAVFVFNGKGRSASVIDASAETLLATIPLDARPEFAVSDAKGSVYVNLEDKDSIAVIDSKARRVRAVWPLAGAHGPSGLAIDREHGLLFAVCDGKAMAVVDVHNGRTVALVPIGERPDAAAFDPGTQLAFSSNGEGSLTVARELSPTAFSVVDSVETQKGARTMALDPGTHNIYLMCAEYLPETDTATALPVSGTAAPGAPRHRPKIKPDSVELLVLKKQ